MDMITHVHDTWQNRTVDCLPEQIRITVICYLTIHRVYFVFNYNRQKKDTNLIRTVNINIDYLRIR